MDTLLRQLTTCFGNRRIRLPTSSAPSDAFEKALLASDTTPPEMSAQRVKDLALFVRNVMMESTKPREDLRQQINELVHEEGGWWSEALATKILESAVRVVELGVPLGSTMTVAYNRAVDEASKMLELAEDFAHEHPVLTTVACVIIALGILYLLCPWALGALGFTELGPAAGSWAARWEAMYGGRIPVGSLFSYLQRLGMIWRGGVLVASKL